MRRVRLFELENLSLFSSFTDEEIDDIIRDYIARHGSATGESYLHGYVPRVSHLPAQALFPERVIIMEALFNAWLFQIFR